MADLECGVDKGSDVIAAVNNNTNNKVDKIAGKGLSEEDYSTTEKNRLANIEAGATTDQTASEIKVAYESNPDTNPFTDTEKTKLSNIEDNATADQSDVEIKTAYENNANTNEFSDSEKSKLAGLESSHFKGQYVSLAALQAAHPTSSIGDYANVDTGAGNDVLRYVWDNDDTAWVEQLGSSAVLSDAEIKTQYENNANTNPYTDSEKTKLAGVEAEAEVNTVDINTAQTFTEPQRTVIGGGDNSIALANNQKVSFAATAVNVTVENQIAGQSGSIRIFDAENVPGWGPEFNWGNQGEPADLNGTEVFGYEVWDDSGADSITIGRV